MTNDKEELKKRLEEIEKRSKECEHPEDQRISLSGSKDKVCGLCGEVVH
jgi:tetrahydromethanopterin S-methyltransferase subunit G